MFGHRKVGEGWTSETVLYHVMRSVFPEVTILRHHRPEWLGGLELDLFMVEPNIGVEYQGVQHFKPVKHWGGEDGLRRLRERDRRKKKLCEARGVILVCFYHDEPIADPLVRERLGPLVSGPPPSHGDGP
jgi:hypothetical protein